VVEQIDDQLVERHSVQNRRCVGHRSHTNQEYVRIQNVLFDLNIGNNRREHSGEIQRMSVAQDDLVTRHVGEEFVKAQGNRLECGPLEANSLLLEMPSFEELQRNELEYQGNVKSTMIPDNPF
jgi:hypothetical protein